jgi:hypothetical protein
MRPRNPAKWTTWTAPGRIYAARIELIARGEYRRVAKLIAEIEYPGIS